MVEHRDERYMREKEDSIAPQGMGKALGRLKRVYKWDTKNVIPDDGFVSSSRLIFLPERIEHHQARAPQQVLASGEAYIENDLDRHLDAYLRQRRS